jgi:putative transposase
MKRSRYTEEQIIDILKEQETGTPVTEPCRKHGMRDATSYNWKSKYGGLEVSEPKRLPALEAENAKLKRLLADAMLDNTALVDLLGKNVWPLPSCKVRGDGGRSRVSRCCGRAMMRSERIVARKWFGTGALFFQGLRHADRIVPVGSSGRRSSSCRRRGTGRTNPAGSDRVRYNKSWGRSNWFNVSSR